MNYTIEKIAGIDCIFAPMPDSNSITIQIKAKAGSNYETVQTNGLAHFLEHNFFKGWSRYTTPRAVAEALDKIWWAFNARTGDSGVCYYVKSAPNFFEQSLDVLADMMMNPTFLTPELEREKWVVIQELKMYEDMPKALVADKRQKRYYGDNNYGRSTIWTIENILSFTQKDLFDYKNALYTKDNLIIVVAGKILDPEKIKKLISDYFSGLPTAKTISKPAFPFYLPSSHSDFFDKKTEQNHLIISARGFDGNDDRRHAAKVLMTILGWNMSSRLFQNIREKQGLCYYIRWYHSSEPQYWDFTITAGIDKERFDFWVEKIFAEIADVASGNITKEEFDNAISNATGSIQMGIETSDSMADFVGEQYLHYWEIETLDQKLAYIQSVEFEEVREVTKMLDRDQLYLYWIQ